MVSGLGVAKYQFLRSAIAGPFQLGTVQTEFQFTVFRDVPPMVALIFCIEVDACQGTYSKNSLRFVNPKYRSLKMEVRSLTKPFKTKKLTFRFKAITTQQMVIFLMTILV